MIVSGYSMDLYCDAENKAHAYREFPQTFTGKNERECRGQAKLWGWRLVGQKAYCPKCSKPKEPPHP